MLVARRLPRSINASGDTMWMQVSKPEVYAGLAPQQRCLLERREAEQILCILSILASVFECLDSTSGMATPDLQVDLRQLINQHPYTQVQERAST